MISRIIKILIATILTLALGVWVGRAYDRVPLGIVTGLLVDIPLGAFWITKRRRWVFTAALNVLFVLSYVVGKWMGVGYALMVSGLTFIISAAIIRELYGGNEFKAIFHHIRVAVGLLKGFQIIRNGTMVLPTSPEPPLGPHLTIIGPENAVVMQRGAKQTRISGPAVFDSQEFEYVKKIYDLSQKQKSFTLTDVLTQDLLGTTVTVSAVYGIDIPLQVRRGQACWEPQHEETIQRIDGWIPDWEAATGQAVENAVRQAVGVFVLSELLSSGRTQTLEQRILSLANERMNPRDIQLSQVTVTSVQPQDSVKAATANRWIAVSEAQTAIVAESARAEAWKQALRLLADGYREAEEKGMPKEALCREVLRRTLEQITKDPAAKVFMTPDVYSALSGLRNVVGVDY